MLGQPGPTNPRGPVAEGYESELRRGVMKSIYILLLLLLLYYYYYIITYYYYYYYIIYIINYLLKLNGVC